MKKRKGLSTKISSNDQSLIKYLWYNYDPTQIESLKFTFSLGLTYLRGAKFGMFILKSPVCQNSQLSSKDPQLSQNQSKTQEITFFDTGTVETISQNLQQIQSSVGEYFIVKQQILKKSALQLFEMRLCEHTPNKITLQKLEEQKKITEQFKLKFSRKIQQVDPIYCQKCNQKLYYFYQPKQKSITLGDVLKQIQLENEDQQCKNIEWCVILNEPFTKAITIATHRDATFYLDECGKISFLQNWSEINPCDKSMQILRYKPVYCQHEKVQSNICQYCLEEVDCYDIKYRKYLFQMEEKDQFKREMITTGSTLTEQENKFVDDLIHRQRGILILDLDNTVLHSIELGQIPKNRLADLQDYYQLKLGSQLHYNSQIGQHYVTSCFIVKMRPYFKEFIQTAIKYYEIYVYTKGTRQYAEQICNAIRNQYASKEFFSINKNTNLNYFQFLHDKNAFTPSRIITRDEDPDLQKKSLNYILPTRRELLMVMDDLGSVWNYSSAVLFTVPFHFFFLTKHLLKEKQKSNQIVNSINEQTLLELKQETQIRDKEDFLTIEPARELVCDHFERQVEELQKKLSDSVFELSCCQLTYNINQSQKNFIKEKAFENNQFVESKDILVQISVEPQDITIVEIKKKGLAPDDQDYEFDVCPRPDFYLIFAAYNLLLIHKQFYSLLNQSSLSPPLKKLSFGSIYCKIKSQILKGTVIKFGMKNQSKIDVYGRAIKLGCKVIPNESQIVPQYIIRLNNLKTNVDRMYFKKEEQKEKNQILKMQNKIQGETIKLLKFYCKTLKIPIVSESWIHFCYCFSYKFPVDPFVMDCDEIYKTVQEQEYEWVIQKYAKQLLQQIKQGQKLQYKNQ